MKQTLLNSAHLLIWLCYCWIIMAVGKQYNEIAHYDLIVTVCSHTKVPELRRHCLSVM